MGGTRCERAEKDLESNVEADAAGNDVSAAKLDSQAKVETALLESDADSDEGRWKLHLPSGLGAVVAACCLFALPYLFWNGSNGAINDEEEDAMIGAKWVLEKEKGGEESEQVLLDAVPSAFAAAAVTSSPFFPFCSRSSSFRSTCRSLLGQEDGKAVTHGNTTDGDWLAVVEMEAELDVGGDAVA